MSKLLLQRILLVAGVLALIIVVIDGTYSIVATMAGSTPARVDHVTAGPYQLTVNMYQYPANAGFALPFSVAPAQPVNGTLNFHIDSYPGKGVDANPVRATFGPSASVHNGIQGAAEITVQGPWRLQIQVDGPMGRGIANVPITATALPPIPTWLGWLLGFIPFYVLIVFFAVKYVRGRNTTPDEQEVVGNDPKMLKGSVTS